MLKSLDCFPGIDKCHWWLNFTLSTTPNSSKNLSVSRGCKIAWKLHICGNWIIWRFQKNNKITKVFSLYYLFKIKFALYTLYNIHVNTIEYSICKIVQNEKVLNHSCLNNICFVFLCLIKVVCSMLTLLHICFPFMDINENTIFLSIFTLWCSSCNETSLSKSDILVLQSNSATISLVISIP